MTEDEGGPKPPIPQDRERGAPDATGGDSREMDESSSGEGAVQSGGDDRAIDVDLAHDRAS